MIQQRLALNPPFQGSPSNMIEATCFAFFWDSRQVGGIAIREEQVTVRPVICWALCELPHDRRLCGFVLMSSGLANAETMEGFRGYDTHDHVKGFVEEHYGWLKFEDR